ncbi:Leucine-rich repeat, partial [Trinorchestia longiramus]
RWTCLPPEPRSTLKSSDTPDVCRCNSIDVFWSAFNAEQADLRNHTDLSDDHCTYYNNTRTVVCSGSQVIEVPTLKTLIEEVNTMIFDETNIKCLEEQAATERLPKSRGLGFTNGALSEIKPGFLAEIRTNELTLSNNSLSEWNFSWFASENSSNITSINLAQNFIQFLPNPEVGPEFVLPHLNTLTLSDNPLLVIPPDLFKPLTHSPVKCLGLRNCCLENFGKDDNNNITSSLKFLRHLESLDLSNNPRLTSYKLSRFLSPLRGRRLHTLVLSGNGYVTVPYSALETVSSSLENLDLHSSSFSCLDNSSFPYLPRLRILNLDFSRISSLLPGTFDSTPNLESLSLQSNHFLNIPPALRLPTLKELNFKGNPRIEDEHEECAFLLENDSFRGMTGLEYLNLAETPLQHIYTGQFLGMRSLQSLTLTRCLIRTIEPGAFATLENLHALYLNSNLLELLDNNSFSGLHNLTILNLNDNDITLTRPYPSPVIPLVASEVQSHKKSVERYNGERYDEQSGEKENYLGSETSFSTSPRPFSMLKKLQKLFLASNRIGELIPVFDDLESLTFLDLKRNVVYDWTKRVLQFNLNLSKLDLEDNRLTSFTDAMIQDFNNENLIEINIKMNSFICSCSLYDAQEKLNSENFVDYEGYTCTVEDTFPEEHRLFTDDPGDCSPEAPDDSKSSKTSNVFLVVASIGLVTTALAAAFVFRRKRLRNGDSIDAKREEIQTKISYQYDVFICYAATDKKWVFNTLLPVFENTFGLQVCVHERDFEPGDMIVENISSSISKSRKVLFVVSPASISSHWCRLELDYTRVSSVNEGTNKLIMLQKEAVPPEDQPQNLRHILNTRTYIEWTEDSRVQALAWTKLRRVLTKQRGSAK